MNDIGAKAFGRLYDENVSSVYGFFGYAAASREEAEELTCSTFERALREWSGFDARLGSAAIWLMRIARDVFLDRLSDRSPHPQWAGGFEAADRPGSDAGVDGESNWPSPELTSALTRLSVRDRTLVALRFGAGLGEAQIAQLSDVSPIDVGSALQESIVSLGDAGQSDRCDPPGSPSEPA